MSLPEPETSQMPVVDGQSQSWQGDGEEMQASDKGAAVLGELEDGDTSQGVEGEGDAEDVDGGADADAKAQGGKGKGKGKAADEGTDTKKKRERRELEREEGKSVFPVARVQRALKADKVLSFTCLRR